MSAAGDACSLFDAHIDGGLDLFDLVFVYLAAHLGLGLPRHADFDAVEGLHGVVYEPVVDILMYEDARTGAADLSLVEEDAELQSVHRHVPFAVGEVDVRRFAAELQRRRYQTVRRRLRHASADVGRAGKGQFPEPLVLQHELSGLGALAGDDVEDAGRQDVADEARKLQHRERSKARRFEYRAAARREHRRELPGRHEEGEIPWYDLSDDADRFAENYRHGVLVEHRRAAFLGAHRSREIAEVVRREGNVDGHRLTDRFAVVERFYHREMFFVCVNHVGDLEQKISPFGRGDIFPTLPCLPSRTYGKVYVFPRCLRTFGQRMPVSRAMGLKVFPVIRRPPFSIDKQPILFLQFRFIVQHIDTPLYFAFLRF